MIKNKLSLFHFKIIIGFVSTCAIFGCRGPKGDQGPSGVQGSVTLAGVTCSGNSVSVTVNNTTNQPLNINNENLGLYIACNTTATPSCYTAYGVDCSATADQRKSLVFGSLTSTTVSLACECCMNADCNGTQPASCAGNTVDVYFSAAAQSGLSYFPQIFTGPC